MADYSDEIKNISDIIIDWDPIGLFPHAPENEYDIEVGRLLSYLEKHDTVLTIADSLQKVFTEAFGKDTFNRPFIECAGIAQKILRAAPSYCGCKKYG